MSLNQCGASDRPGATPAGCIACLEQMYWDGTTWTGRHAMDGTHGSGVDLTPPLSALLSAGAPAVVFGVRCVSHEMTSPYRRPGGGTEV